MMRLLIACALLLLCTHAKASVDYPKLELSNQVINVSLYLPDAENGFYRGPRFDWSGMIGRVSYLGNQFYAPFYADHDPLVHDAVSGPAEEFGMYNPMGFADAAAGETFIKIGVGLLRKDDTDKYLFNGQYEIVEPGRWEIEHGKDWIDFRQQLDGGNGWAYRYHKRIELTPELPEFTISHRLENIGTKTIDLDNYNHNFTLIDDVPYGPDYSVEFPFSTREPEFINQRAWYRGNSIEVTEPLGDNFLWALVYKAGEDNRFNQGEPVTEHAPNNRAVIRNNKTGAAVTITGDAPVTHYIFYAMERAACPEPFISIKLEPGEVQEWTSTYTFSGSNEN